MITITKDPLCIDVSVSFAMFLSMIDICISLVYAPRDFVTFYLLQKKMKSFLQQNIAVSWEISNNLVDVVLLFAIANKRYIICVVIFLKKVNVFTSENTTLLLKVPQYNET